jgi:hypothetical protein
MIWRASGTILACAEFPILLGHPAADSSDLGQANNPFPAEWFRKICSRLIEANMPERDVRMLVADNSARLLGVA